jgi:predicted amino acid racemase
MLLRAPGRRDVADAVRWADYSLNSSAETVKLLSEAAGLAGVQHKVVIMVDVGDLREGLWPDRALDAIRAVSHLPHIELAGLGTYLACYGGVQPTGTNMAMLVDIRDQARAATGLPLELLSGGNSANLPLMVANQLPGEINHLRVGETICLGRNVADRSPWPGTRQDTVRIVAEVIEMARKPSIPIGTTGQDAFGNRPVFADMGVRLRAICNIGRQDVASEALTPEDPGIIILGASSDHLILDVTDATRPVGLGGEVGFWPTYGGLSTVSMSPDVWKVAVLGQ